MPDQNPRKVQSRPSWARILWIIIKNLFVPVLCIGGLIFGLLIGYTYVGGQPASEVFMIETWKHLYDLVFAK